MQGFLQSLETNGNLKILATNSDNKTTPVHRWFPFLVGFSHTLVKATLKHFNKNDFEYNVFDPFMGSGTTAIACKELGINAVGNETNRFLYDICQVKINAAKSITEKEFVDANLDIMRQACKTWLNENLSGEHEILKKCFYPNNLKKLVALRNAILDMGFDGNFNGYCFMALTRSLNKAAKVGLNIPYISWKNERTPQNAFKLYEENISLISKDASVFSKSAENKAKVNVYLHDSRIVNSYIGSETVDMVFTSPPYLNNFDYGEALKVFLYFWKYANNWKEITETVRKKSVTSATTYYNKTVKGLTAHELLGEEFVGTLPCISEQIDVIVRDIRQKGAERDKERCNAKSFDFLSSLYFKDMFSVLSEIYRVLKDNSLACIIIGDSAPYGVYIPTDTILGNMALGLGFSSFTQKTLRERGTKWTTLKYRHNLKLRESLLILRK